MGVTTGRDDKLSKEAPDIQKALIAAVHGSSDIDGHSGPYVGLDKFVEILEEKGFEIKKVGTPENNGAMK